MGVAHHSPKLHPLSILSWLLLHSQGESQDLLFFMTARYHLAVVSYDAATGDLVTRAYGDVKVGRKLPLTAPPVMFEQPFLMYNVPSISNFQG